jgi:predicted Fe-Mo cluster-binding NifX family protein
MKVCIPNSGLLVPRHFGKAAEFALVTVEDGHIVASEVVPNPGRDRVKVPVFLAAFGVTHVIAAGIGNPAAAVFAAEGAVVYAGAAGTVETVLGQFMRGELKSKKMSCAGENKCGLQHPK